jgi:hypothetical protein
VITVKFTRPFWQRQHQCGTGITMLSNAATEGSLPVFFCEGPLDDTKPPVIKKY